MKQSLAALFLSFSAFSAGHAQAPSINTAPWLDNKPTSQVNVDPFKPEGATRGSLKDFGFAPAASAEKPWMDEARERMTAQAPKGPNELAEDFDMHVFISAGMPEGVLRQLFKQALANDPKRIRFIVRGFEPQKIGVLMNKLRHLLPDPYVDDVIVEVDPNAFRAYGVDAVPVYLVKESSKWYEIRGTASLEAARSYAKKGGNYTAGEKYAIAEPDILSVIEERARNYDWKPVMERARSRIAQNMRPGFDLPTSARTATVYHTPTFTAPHDITGPAADGHGETVIAHAGQTFALLDYTRLQVPVIVVDATDMRQLKMLGEWVKRPEYKDADIFIVGSTVQPRDPQSPVTLDMSRSLKRPVFPMQQRLSERFGLEAVPAIVEQEGRALRIRYFEPSATGL